MHLLGFLLLPIVLTMGRHVDIKNIALKIENNILTEVRVTGQSPNYLDLSNLGLETIKEGAFSQLSNLKTLNLSNNSITSLPELIFSNLQNLEELNLADNLLEGGQFFEGLSNLRSVNICNNPMTHISSGDFSRIPKSAKILTRGIKLGSISPTIFKSSPIPVPSHCGGAEIRYAMLDTPRYKVCIQNGHLKSLEEWTTGELLTDDCSEVPNTNDIIALQNMGIKTFQRGWYRLQESIFTALTLANNEIVTITKEMLNDLPEEIVKISLSGNKIKRLDAGVIERASPIDTLDLSNNLISEIADGALEKLRFTEKLLLDWNRLSNTKFVKSLPKISNLSLSHNNIEEVEKGSFMGMNQLYNLNLAFNPLKKLENGALAGLSEESECRVSFGIPWSIEFIQSGLFDEV